LKLPRSIHQFLSWFPHQEFAALACAVFIVGLFSGKAVMSIGMMLLLGNAIINLKVKDYFKAFAKDRTSLLFVGLFLLYALSFFWSEDSHYFLSRMRLMMPFLVLPFAFKSIIWEAKYFHWLMSLFIIMCAAGATWSLYHYVIDKEAIDASYGFSKSMPTPFKGDHIRFGVAIVIGFSFVFYTLKQQPAKLMRWFLFFVGAYFFIYLHLLASKTALLSLYLFIFYQLFLWFRSSKKWLVGLGSLLLLISIPFLMYQASDSFRNKVLYTKYSFGQMFNADAQTNVSDEGRFVSFSTALI
jgi:O-antigen ligase